MSSLLADHVALRVRSVDRLFLQGYVLRLQTDRQVVRFLLDRGFSIPSPALLGKMGRLRGRDQPLRGRRRDPHRPVREG